MVRTEFPDSYPPTLVLVGTLQSLVVRDGLAIIGCVTNPEQIDTTERLPRAEDCAGACETGFSSIGITVAKRCAAIKPSFAYGEPLRVPEQPHRLRD